jgi:hypothetical protein
MLSESQWVVLVGVLSVVATVVIAFVLAHRTRRRYAEFRSHFGSEQRMSPPRSA